MTPDQKLEGHSPLVAAIVADIRGAFATTRGADPAFSKLVNVDEVVRFILLRAEAQVLSPPQPRSGDGVEDSAAEALMTLADARAGYLKPVQPRSGEAETLVEKLDATIQWCKESGRDAHVDLKHLQALRQQLAEVQHFGNTIERLNIINRERAVKAEALVLTLTEQLEKAEDSIWTDVLAVVQQAWPTPQDYSQSPAELITRVIDERDAITEQQKEAQRWKDAVTDALVVDWCLSKENEHDPRKAINDLLAWQVKIALDPAVSKEAAEWTTQIAALTEERDRLKAELVNESARVDVVIAEFDAPWPHSHTVWEIVSGSLAWQIHQARAAVENARVAADARAEDAERRLRDAESALEDARTKALWDESYAKSDAERRLPALSEAVQDVVQQIQSVINHPTKLAGNPLMQRWVEALIGEEGSGRAGPKT